MILVLIGILIGIIVCIYDYNTNYNHITQYYIAKYMFFIMFAILISTAIATTLGKIITEYKFDLVTSKELIKFDELNYINKSQERTTDFILYVKNNKKYNQIVIPGEKTGIVYTKDSITRYEEYRPKAIKNIFSDFTLTPYYNTKRFSTYRLFIKKDEK